MDSKKKVLALPPPIYSMVNINKIENFTVEKWIDAIKKTGIVWTDADDMCNVPVVNDTWTSKIGLMSAGFYRVRDYAKSKMLPYHSMHISKPRSMGVSDGIRKGLYDAYSKEDEQLRRWVDKYEFPVVDVFDKELLDKQYRTVLMQSCGETYHTVYDDLVTKCNKKELTIEDIEDACRQLDFRTIKHDEPTVVYLNKTGYHHVLSVVREYSKMALAANLHFVDMEKKDEVSIMIGNKPFIFMYAAILDTFPEAFGYKQTRVELPYYGHPYIAAYDPYMGEGNSMAGRPTTYTESLKKIFNEEQMESLKFGANSMSYKRPMTVEDAMRKYGDEFGKEIIEIVLRESFEESDLERTLNSIKLMGEGARELFNQMLMEEASKFTNIRFETDQAGMEEFDDMMKAEHSVQLPIQPIDMSEEDPNAVFYKYCKEELEKAMGIPKQEMDAKEFQKHYEGQVTEDNFNSIVNPTNEEE